MKWVSSEPRDEVVIVQNWAEELKRLLAVK
jgi:hypothetical protein